MTKLVLDVDTGTDDAIAIMLAALHPDIDLLAVTTVDGNVPLAFTTENTLRVLDAIGVGVPVHSGCPHPLVRNEHPVPRDPPLPGRTHVQGAYLDLPEATSVTASADAVGFLLETFRDPDPDIVLVATGPLTNVAAALIADSGLAARIPRFVMMGGAHHTGNIGPRAEFNVWADPEAARVVLRSGIRDLTMVALDATYKALVSYDDCAALSRLGTTAGTMAAELIETRIRATDKHQPMSRPGTCAVHDALCVAVLLEPALITTRHIYVDVETRGELTVGETVMDVNGRARREPNAKVAFDADGPGFVSVLRNALAHGS